MGVTVQGPNGVTITFPDGTDHDTINNVMSQAIGQKPKAPDVSMAESLGRGALQGATFGFGDEIYAGARGALNKVRGGDFQPEYDTALKEVRGANENARQANPIAYMGGEVAGGFAIPGMGMLGVAGKSAKAARDLTLASRMGRSATTGTVYGGLYGLGTAEGGEGPTIKQFSERAVSAIPSALAGGAVGAVLPPVVDAGAAIVKGATNAIRGSLAPKQVATEKVAEALARDRPEGAALDEAVQYAGDRLQRAQKVNPASVLADVGGENSRNLLRSAANMPSRSADRMRRQLDQRQNVQWRRIEKDLADNLSDGNKFNERLDTWTGVVKDVGREEFNKAYSAPWNVREGSALGDFLKLPYVQRLTEKTAENLRGMTGKDFATEQAGQVPTSADLKPWELLHRVKMQIDREISGLKRGQADSKANWDLRDLTQLKRRMVDLMGQENPAYKSAMEKYGDAASIKAALEQGLEDFSTARADDIRKTLEGMTKPEQMMYRAGYSRAMFNQLEKGNVNKDRTDALFSSPEIQQKLEAVMPDRKRLREFQRALVIHAKQADTRKAVQGNSTTARQLAHGNEAGQQIGRAHV